MANDNKSGGKNISDNAVNIGTQALIVHVFDMIQDKFLRNNKDTDAVYINNVLTELKSRATSGTLASKP